MSLLKEVFKKFIIKEEVAVSSGPKMNPYEMKEAERLINAKGYKGMTTDDLRDENQVPALIAKYMIVVENGIEDERPDGDGWPAFVKERQNKSSYSGDEILDFLGY